MKLIWITQAHYLDGYKFSLTFNDGLPKDVDLENTPTGKLFEPLRNTDIFKKFHLSDWSIEWENGVDLAPEYLYNL